MTAPEPATHTAATISVGTSVATDNAGRAHIAHLMTKTGSRYPTTSGPAVVPFDCSCSDQVFLRPADEVWL